jgi:tRNA-dihydrouridine synthase 3
MSLRTILDGALVMGPMTKGSNLPYRRLCVELGARVTMSEMTVARRLKQRRASEFALIRRFAGEPFFGVQLAGTNPDELAWAAALVESRGADLVDLNCGCPIDHFTHKGIGASLGRQPNRLRRLVEAMKKAVTAVPVTAKIQAARGFSHNWQG